MPPKLLRILVFLGAALERPYGLFSPFLSRQNCAALSHATKKN